MAERGFRGTSMSAVAERAGVAAGTAYVHYASKDELIVATYVVLGFFIAWLLAERASLAASGHKASCVAGPGTMPGCPSPGRRG